MNVRHNRLKVTQMPATRGMQMEPLPGRRAGNARQARRLPRRVGLLCVAAALFLVIVEAGARVVVAHKDQLKGQLPIPMSMLHEYQERDPRKPANWILKAGFVETFAESLARTRTGQEVDRTPLPTGAGEAGTRPNDVFIRINKDGFRGPELDASHSRPRVIAIGDSITFGTIESRTYPRIVERGLQKRGLNVEVINAGVEGYSPKNVLYRIDHFKQLRPDVVTLFIGWTPLFAGTQWVAMNQSWARLDTLRLASIGFNLALQAVQRPQASVKLKPAHKNADPDAPEVRRLSDFVPDFMPEMETIVREMRAAGAKVVIITLPGLYTSDAPISEKALKIGHLPTFTDNPYVFAKMTEGYNAALRRLAEREHVQLIDLESWSRTALTPRDRYFADSVHPHEDGQELLGAYLAEQLAPSLAGTSTLVAKGLQ
jgi:lysophospholipase L1-like esterase